MGDDTGVLAITVKNPAGNLISLRTGWWSCAAVSGAVEAGIQMIRVSVADSVARGRVRSGGTLEKILTEAEKVFVAKPPRSSVEAFELLDRAAKSVDPGFSAGIPHDLQPVVAGQDKFLLNSNGGKTLVKANGEIIVADSSGNVIQHLVPTP